jgi:hypothetical protein
MEEMTIFFIETMQQKMMLVPKMLEMMNLNLDNVLITNGDGLISDEVETLQNLNIFQAQKSQSILRF